MRMRLGVPAIAALMLATAARAEDVKMDTPVPGHPGVTYENLLKQVLPDLARGDEGRSVFWVSQGIPIRDTEGEMDETGAVSLANLETATLRHDGKDYLTVLAADGAASGWLAIVAVYDMEPATPKLIDAVNAGMDRMTLLGEPVALSASEGGITVTGAHGNSNEYFESVQMLMLREQTLASVFYAGTYSLQVCGMEMKQGGVLETEPDPARPFAALVYTITQDVKRPAEDCGEDGMTLLPAGVKTARDVFQWDEASGKFIATTSNANQLMGPE